jgi:hypothetical protein
MKSPPFKLKTNQTKNKDTDIVNIISAIVKRGVGWGVRDRLSVIRFFGVDL